jgi:ABC-type cobalamin transport system permease subunit
MEAPPPLLKWRGDSRETSFDEGVYILDRSANAVGSLRLPRAVALLAVLYPLAIQAALERVVLFSPLPSPSCGSASRGPVELKAILDCHRQ